MCLKQRTGKESDLKTMDWKIILIFKSEQEKNCLSIINYYYLSAKLDRFGLFRKG